MIVELTDKIPLGIEWTDWSAREFAETPSVEKIVKGSDQMWQVLDQKKRCILVAGVYAPTIIGTIPELWLLIAKDFEYASVPNLRDLFALGACLRQVYRRLEVKIKIGHWAGRRMAQRVGFVVKDTVELRGELYWVLECRS